MTFVSAVLSNSFKSRIASLFSMNLSRLFHCSVIKVLCLLSLYLSDATPISYHIFLTLSTTFLFFFEKVFLKMLQIFFIEVLCCFVSFTAKFILALCFPFVNTFFYFFQTLKSQAINAKLYLRNIISSFCTTMFAFCWQICTDCPSFRFALCLFYSFYASLASSF